MIDPVELPFNERTRTGYRDAVDPKGNFYRREYFLNNKYHRNNDLPAIYWADGVKFWYQHRYLHRDNNLPAQIYPDKFYYYQNGKLHRTNGPAIEYVIFTEMNVFWLFGKYSFTADQEKEYYQHLKLLSFL